MTHWCTPQPAGAKLQPPPEFGVEARASYVRRGTWNRRGEMKGSAGTYAKKRQKTTALYMYNLQQISSTTGLATRNSLWPSVHLVHASCAEAIKVISLSPWVLALQRAIVVRTRCATARSTLKQHQTSELRGPLYRLPS